MDDIAVGRVLRELRIRLGWPQRVVASKARVSATTYSDIERGLLEGVTLGKLRRVAAILEVRLVLEPRWRGAGLERIVAGRHAFMTETVAAMLVAAGWDVRPEVSFSHLASAASSISSLGMRRLGRCCSSSSRRSSSIRTICSR